MWRRTGTKEELEKPASVDAKTGIALLHQQIEEAKRLLDNRPIKSAEYLAWNNATREDLTRIYGSNSPNIETIISAPGNTPVWMGMSDAVLERYEASSIENKITMLEACILWLKLEITDANIEKSDDQRY
ncbi:MAG: hypothetical protein V3W19_00365 [Desulfatiglandales bacterium]